MKNIWTQVIGGNLLFIDMSLVKITEIYLCSYTVYWKQIIWINILYCYFYKLKKYVNLVFH